MRHLRFQQGDVFFYAVDSLPKGLEPLDTNVVQEGEATGHAHRLHGDGFRLYQDPRTKRKHLLVVKPTALRHEEHKEIVLPPGEYEILIVREYDHFEEESRLVAD